MHTVSAKQLIAIVIMVVVAISGTGMVSAAKASCLVDASVAVAHATDSHCIQSSLAEEAAEYIEASCSPYAPDGVSSIFGSISTHSPNWLIYQPFPQLLPERLDKPPRLLLPL